MPRTANTPTLREPLALGAAGAVAMPTIEPAAWLSPKGCGVCIAW
jgi:hypothetical protein